MFTVQFSFGLEISELLVEWKAPERANGKPGNPEPEPEPEPELELETLKYGMEV